MMGAEWYSYLADTLCSPVMMELGEKLRGKTITPSWDKVFRAYELCPPSEMKVLIVGQDPYPTPGQAMGLAFSSGNGKLPYSLQNIFEDLKLCDYDGRTRRRVDLTDWAEQGVMLLNTCLTTEPGKPFAHRGWGWEELVSDTLEVISGLTQSIVVMAWGKPAQGLVDGFITPGDDRLILKAAHPANERYQKGSYIGSKHFKLGNRWLKSRGVEPIKWI